MESYRRAAAAFERMSRDEPSVVQYEDDLAGCYLNMGNLLRAMGQPAAAIESYRKGLVVFERLEHQHPTNTQVRVDLAVSHMNIGNVLSDMGRRDDALTSSGGAADPRAAGRRESSCPRVRERIGR